MSNTSASSSRLRPIILIALFLAIVLPRFLSLGTMLTVDEPLWLSRGHQFIQGIASGHWENTIVALQPGITTAWLIGLADRFHSLAASQAAIALATSLWLVIIAYFLWQLLGWQLGILVAFFLALNPFLIAHSRVAHTDALLALSYLASLLVFLTAMKTTSSSEKLSWRYIILSGFCAGFAILTKVFALILLPTVFCLGLWFAWQYKLGLKKTIRIGLVWLVSCVATIYILWPALWTHPLDAYHFLSGGVASHANTRDEETTAAWWYYAREGLFRLTPITTVLAPVGLWFLLKDKNYRQRNLFIVLLISGLAYAILLSLKGEKSDRYILFTILTLDIVAAYGLHQLGIILLPRSRAGAKALVILALGSLLLLNIYLHPFYLAHYNYLYPIEARHKLGWGEGLEQGAAWIAQNNPQAKVATYYPRVFSYFYKGQGSIDSLIHAADDPHAFVVLYRGMFERSADSPESDFVRNFLDNQTKTPIHIISLNGLPYVWIFAPHDIK